MCKKSLLLGLNYTETLSGVQEVLVARFKNYTESVSGVQEELVARFKIYRNLIWCARRACC